VQYVTINVKKHNTSNILVHLYKLQYCVHSCSVLSFIREWNLDWKLGTVTSLDCLASHDRINNEMKWCTKHWWCNLIQGLGICLEGLRSIQTSQDTLYAGWELSCISEIYKSSVPASYCFEHNWCSMERD